MSDEFNFEMTTKYKPEFESLATYDQLYQQLAKERIENEGVKPKENEDYVGKMRDIVSGKDASSVKKKLKRQLHLDIKLYDSKSDEEKYNVLKLLRFIVKSNRYEEQDSDSVLKTVSVINLIAKPSLDHTDAAHSVYEEHFRNIIEEIRPAVHDAEDREKTIDWIHDLWEKIHTTLDFTVLEERQLYQDDLRAINQRLKCILDYLDKKKIAKLQRPNESIIDTFYNILISSRIVAEIEDMKKVVYTYKKEKTVPYSITELSLDKIFSEPMTWKEFHTLIKRTKVDLTDRKIQMFWSVLLCKENVTIEDIHNITQTDYNFAEDYTETIAEYWVKEKLQHETIALGEWIIVFQELMCIHHDKLEYKNSYIRRNNSKTTLTAAIKSFEEKSQLPHLIVLKRLTHRLLLSFGTKELFKLKLRANKYLMRIENIIFSYKNIEDIKTAHNLLYFQVISSLATNRSRSDIPEITNWVMHINLIGYNFSLPILVPESNSQLLFESVMNILAQDRQFRLARDKNFMRYSESTLKAFSNGAAEGLTFIANHKVISEPEYAYDIMATTFAEEIKRICNNPPSDNSSDSYSQFFSIPIYYGDGNEYNLNIQFKFSHQSNKLIIHWFRILGKGIDSFDRYTELLLGMDKPASKEKHFKMFLL